MHEAGRSEQLVVLIKDERARAERAEAQLAEAKEQAHYANGVADLAMQHRDSTEAERDALRKALADLVNFAWTAVTADCEEARVNLNGKIAKARAALAPSTD